MYRVQGLRLPLGFRSLGFQASGFRSEGLVGVMLAMSLSPTSVLQWEALLCLSLCMASRYTASSSLGGMKEHASEQPAEQTPLGLSEG